MHLGPLGEFVAFSLRLSLCCKVIGHLLFLFGVLVIGHLQGTARTFATLAFILMTLDFGLIETSKFNGWLISYQFG